MAEDQPRISGMPNVMRMEIWRLVDHLFSEALVKNFRVRTS